MSQRTRVVGTRSFIVWLLIIIAVVLVAALAVAGLVVYPRLQEQQAEQARLAQADQHYQAGIAFQDVGDWEAAEAEYRQVVTLDAGYKDTKARLAEVKARLAEKEAIATAVAMAQAEQARVDAQATATGQAQATSEARANAEATAAAAPAATAEALEAHYQKGLGYINIRRWVEAKTELERVFEANPNYKEVQAKLAEVEAEIAKLTPAATPTPITTATPTPTATPVTKVVYSNDFEGVVGPEWSNTAKNTTPSGRGFLGEFSNGTVSLTFSGLPPHTEVRVSFDLFIIRSWDGNSQVVNPSTSEAIGPDVWDLNAGGGPTLLHTTFSNWEHYSQAYPDPYPGGDHPARTGAVENNTLGYRHIDDLLDAVYRLNFTFAHSAGSLVLYFSAIGREELSNESWGLDNVEVGVMVKSEVP